MKYNFNGIELLRNAIVKDAAKEYMRLKKEIKKLEKMPTTEKRAIRLKEKNNEFENLKKWFMSDRFDELGLSLDGEDYVRLLDSLSESKQIHHRAERHIK